MVTLDLEPARDGPLYSVKVRLLLDQSLSPLLQMFIADDGPRGVNVFYQPKLRLRPPLELLRLEPDQGEPTEPAIGEVAAFIRDWMVGRVRIVIDHDGDREIRWRAYRNEKLLASTFRLLRLGWLKRLLGQRVRRREVVLCNRQSELS